MPAYEWADLWIETAFEMPELPAGTSGAATEAWHVRVGSGRAPLRQPRRWFRRWRQADGRCWLSFARQPAAVLASVSADGYLLRFHQLADFVVDPATRRIDGYRTPATPDHTFNHLLLDHVLPLVAGNAERLAIHASVVEIDGHAVAFLGAARQGKSTLAAALARRGHPVLSDDCCVLRRSAGGMLVAPTYPGLRLFPESIDGVFGRSGAARPRVAHYSSKERIVPAGAFDRRPLPLGGLYVIAAHGDASAGGVRIAPQTSRQGVLEVVGVTFCLDVADKRRVRDGFALAAAAVSACPVRALTVPWSLAALDSVAASIVADQRR